jgi:4-amino-4-deoxy-L-arabinose transferase-like glycosyltransferase
MRAAGNARQGGRAIFLPSSLTAPALQVLPSALSARSAAGLLLGCLVLYLVGAKGYDLLTDDEIRYAEAGRQMIEGGDWVLPEFNGSPRYQKPVFFYWLQALSQRIGGSTPLAARVPTALAGAVLVLLTAHLGSRLWGRTAGLWAGVVLGTAVAIVLGSRMVLTDVVLLLFIQGAISAFCLGRLAPGGRRRYVAAGTVCCALGMLTKGPVAVALPAAVVLPWLIVRREVRPFLRLRTWAWAVALFVAVAGWWFAWVHWHTHGQFTRHFFWEENVGRFSSVVNDHHQPFYFHLVLLVPLTFPWTGVVFPALRSAWSRLRLPASPGEPYCGLFLWQILVVLGLFTVSRTKVWTYTLPLFPALALLIGRWMALSKGGAEDRLRKLVRGLLALTAGGSLVVAGGTLMVSLARLPEAFRSKELLLAVAAWVAALAVLAVGVLVLGRRRRPVWQLGATAAGVSLWYLAGFAGVLPLVDGLWKGPTRAVAAAVRAYPRPQVITYNVHELSLNFHAGVRVVRHWRGGCEEALEDLLRSPEPTFILAAPSSAERLGGLPFHVWGRTPRFVYGANVPPPAGLSPSATGLPGGWSEAEAGGSLDRR